MTSVLCHIFFIEKKYPKKSPSFFFKELKRYIRFDRTRSFFFKILGISHICHGLFYPKNWYQNLIFFRRSKTRRSRVRHTNRYGLRKNVWYTFIY